MKISVALGWAAFSAHARRQLWVQTGKILYIINREHGLHVDRVSAEEDEPMPWKETSTMDQRIQFIADYLSGRYSKKALCIHYGVSRPTGDKWIERYRIHGSRGTL